MTSTEFPWVGSTGLGYNDETGDSTHTGFGYGDETGDSTHTGFGYGDEIDGSTHTGFGYGDETGDSTHTGFAYNDKNEESGSIASSITATELPWGGSTEFPEFPWESQYQYKSRVYKIQQHTESLGLLRATALANVWANYHFLGCSYPVPVLESIKDWDPPPKNQELEEKLAELQQLEKEAMYDETLVNQRLKLKDLKFKMYYSGFEQQPPPVVLFYNSSQTCKVPCSFVENEGVSEGKRTVSLFINDIHVSDGRATSFKDAKHACANNALKYLKKKGLVIVSPQNVDEEAVSKISKDILTGKGGGKGDNYEENRIAEDNVGCKLLKAMGWTSDTGLGKDGQGRVNPISTIGQLNRGGLGSQNSEAGICHQSVQQQLLDFLRNADLMKLEFTDELDNLERKMIHKLSGKYGLKHKSRGSGASRKLVVWKEETSVSEILAEPVTQFDEEDNDFQMGTEGPVGADLDITSTYHLNSLSLDPLVEGESDIVMSSGKRKMEVAPAQSKVSRNANVHFDYNNSNSRSKRGAKKSSGQRRRGGERTIERRQPENQSKTYSKSRGPFREGYVDPYLVEPPRETYRRPGYETEQQSRRNPNWRSDPPQSNNHATRGRRSEGYVEDSSRDPRTHYSSGFGIYRHMKPRTRR